MTDHPANAMLDAIERLIEAQLAITPEARPALAARLARMFPEMAPRPVPVAAPAAIDGLVASQILAGLRAGDNRKWTAAEHEARARAKALLVEMITPSQEEAA